jgi:hypothetical protein
MNGFTENRAPGASERPGPNERVLTWGASLAMLPLVGRIARDIVSHHARLARLQPEQDRLDRRRHTLSWPERSRRYQLQEEIHVIDTELRAARSELDTLGIALLDPACGLVGFPTVVNDRRAFFSWQPDEQGLNFWNYAGDRVRRPVPEHWTRPQREPAPRGKRRPEKR